MNNCYVRTNLYSFNNAHKDNRLFFDKQKFAELIIKECADIAYQVEFNDTWETPAHESILAHFGL